MAGKSIQTDVCPKNPHDEKGPHLFRVDKDDKHFKICRWCDQTFYRTNEELLKGLV